MNERMNFGFENIENNGFAEALRSPEDIRDYFSFADEILEVDWGEDGVPEDYTPEYIATHPELTQVFMMRDRDREVIAGGKVTVLTPEMKDRLGLIAREYAERKGVLLEYTAVREEDRNKKFLVALTEQRIAWAKERGAVYAASEIELTNPVSAHTKTRDGFKLVGVREPGAGISHPYFVAVRQFEEDIPVTDEKHERKEVLITEDSEKELTTLFVDGWIGVDARISSDTGPWTLVMERG